MIAGRNLFSMAEKAHYAQRIALDCLEIRDYMGRVAQVARSCLRARGPCGFGSAFILRLRRCAVYRWRQSARLQRAVSLYTSSHTQASMCA